MTNQPHRIPASVYRQRRQRLAAAVLPRPGTDAIVLQACQPSPRNFWANTYPFRQDSSFLYFTGIQQPDALILIRADGETTGYFPARDPDDVLWHGPSDSIEEIARRAGIDIVATCDTFVAGNYLSLPVCNPTATDAELLLGEPDRAGNDALVQATIELRLSLDEHELAAIGRAMRVTTAAHRAAVQATRPGITEQQVAALIEAVFASEGMQPAYGPIVTVRGEILHGHPQDRPLQEGQLLLVDAGAEDPTGYASDVTRTWPVSAPASTRQTELYAAVQAAQQAAIAAVAPGVRFRQLHLLAATVLTEHLLDWGLLRGDRDGLVERGAHAAFFPHGLGHLLGLDVHDMELYGDRAGYAPDRTRSEQFGLSFLRLDRPLQPQMVVTIEPGLYFSPDLLQSARLRAELGDAVDWARAMSWLPVGGIRIEDDVLVTSDAAVVLSEEIEQDLTRLCEQVGSGPDPRTWLRS